ncbi:MAG: YfhO family protein, partial [Chloroflexi bacterium]|nr:YfhO family protein [Chloroflexota bacterium]
MSADPVPLAAAPDPVPPAITTETPIASASALPLPTLADPGRIGRAVLFLLVAIPVLANAVALLPELTTGAPSMNDDAFQYLMVQAADRALTSGANVVDFWMPHLELGFPQFLYYQHLPHLVVVAAGRALVGAVDLLTVFDLARYLLLVGFPLVVFWSMRRMGFSLVAAAVAAAAASLLSGDARYGFEFDSYVWRGLGMFTQLWAMNLAFISLACVYRVLQRGSGYAPALLALTALVLSHLVYAYMMAITLAVVLLVGSRARSFLPRLTRLGILGAIVVAATAYMWLPFVQTSRYLSASAYLEEWKYDSFGAPEILRWLLSGDLLDHGRLPVLTALLAVGIVAALVSRTRLAWTALAGFAVWLVLYFGRPTLGSLVDLFPFSDGLLFHRFIGGVDLFAIVLMGIGGAWAWTLAARIRRPWYPVAWAAVIVLLLAPAIAERVAYYGDNGRWIRETRAALDADPDLGSILDTLAAEQERTGGRAYAGLRSNWGSSALVGPYVHLYDMLAFRAIPAVSPPYQSLSLNADFIWDFRDGDRAQYDLFDVRYVLTPSSFSVPDFYASVRTAGAWSLWRVPTSAAAYVAVTDRRQAPTQRALFDANLAWLRSADPAAGRVIRWDYMQPAGPPAPTPGCEGGGTVHAERVVQDAISVEVECAGAATLEIRATYHPNWRVFVDGVQAPAYMVSPSYIGVDLPAGRHRVDAVYRATPTKSPLIAIGILVIGA